MIPTREEIAFLDVYCHPPTELPLGEPATEKMTCDGEQNGDALNFQWAYLGDKPPTSSTISSAGYLALLLPGTNRGAVLRRDAEIRAIREGMQRTRSIKMVAAPTLARRFLREGRASDGREWQASQHRAKTVSVHFPPLKCPEKCTETVSDAIFLGLDFP